MMGSDSAVPGELSILRGQSSERVRQHNLSVVLTLVHRSAALARSDITRITRLNRSTVSALVGELVERRLVVETDPDSRRQVGRPSAGVEPHPAPVAIAINPEIDAVTIGVVGLGGRVLKRIRFETETPPSVRETVRISAAVIEGIRSELEASHRVVGIGIAVPGLVRTSDGVVRLAPHLRWEEEPLAAMVCEATGFVTSVANDASLGISAERVFGSGRGVTDLVYLNGGASGIGGGIIAGGVTLRGTAGYAGEFGHTLVNSAGPKDVVGSAGSLETEVNRAALLAAVGLATADAEQLETALLESDSPSVADEVRRQLSFLSVALGNAVNLLNPQLVILGGFLATLDAAAPGYLQGLVEANSLRASYEGLSIRRAELGSNLLMIGAAELAFQPLLANPT